MEFSHVPVLLNETIEHLNLKAGGVYVDATLGGGGHSEEILKRADCRVVGLDQDEDALNHAAKRLAPFGDRFIPVKSNFRNIRKVVYRLGLDAVDGVLMDLGVSSFQLDNPLKGFSFQHDGPLDMRMDPQNPKTAADVVNTYPEKELIRIFYEYGEERYAPQIARAIVKRREKKPFTSTLELAEEIIRAVPAKARREKHPAKRVFQAIRIEVNDELSSLEEGLVGAVEVLKPGGRIVVITFHSLEDRLVKNFFRREENPCICPKDFPMCVCGKKPRLKVITKKPLVPSEEEIEKNRRAHSAKLRAAEKLSFA
ncbi:16S rRNA (cytosine(1402)-N(4))-methyltransferase RsmH [Carboxydothermus hydrogenoformans]|uniref:Ribosomal RNA small subunit methyltransferase H n=1 Tax=Carboxydothermus hydrogenoformans (strain ATCC BAA-161 / DSM 6008 / Z-2901) TaxID=246194 RepID=RSMH_CARHZ|nr:16S rRNA (cytosine(1402)-N(4))-methyltransferase RsmH [Carboxydothermus hydrogenoformans]Q3AAD7.1 RecName: Full=Ribosomal RNA small subunit methyltransferase H; AltName: Full=16S rRNA m(4)C1402 methyltransferase; AltName: Full=rRNA (cytosine-N(4)-)-methyltransferase RsmH [Carboxydothermus hydrogenoformans Z-2901]ABB14552.1 S-adenosyl-methyltransferase MraW [Carboxydothermus hydrogenoformans Z-2901]